MITINLDPMLVHLGPFMITWYGLAVAAGFIAGVWITARETQRRGLDPDVIFSLVGWVALGGIVGARLLHVVDQWEQYRTAPLQILNLQRGGLAILGGILGGSLAGGLAAWRRGLPVRRLFDIAAPGIILGQAIGRLGCLVTGDALGRPTDGSWGIVYQHPGAMAPQLGVAYQPVFLYELVWDLGVFAVLWATRRRLTQDGQLFALYLGLYAIGKFALTFFRTEAIWFWGLQEAQLLAIAALIVAMGWALWERRRPVRTQQRSA